MPRSKNSNSRNDTERLELSGPDDVAPQRVAASPHGVVATQHFRASEIGATVLRNGGNAVDAAVAAAFALGVCEPAASGLGGQTMILLHESSTRRTVALDGSSRAPNRTDPELFRERRVRRLGHKATTVPSTPAVLNYVLERYGTFPLSRILEPVVDLADEGYRITPLQNSLMHRDLKKLRDGTAARFFLSRRKEPLAAGALFRQPVLAKTLRLLAAKGVDDFYHGETARLIHGDMLSNGGLVQLDDLAQIPLPVERRPVACRFENLRVLTFPPPGAGRCLVEMLHILQHLPQRLHDPDKPDGAVVLAEIIRQAYLDRSDRPFNPTYFQQAGTRRSLSLDYAARIAGRIRRRLKKPANHKPPETQGETTHLSVMDSAGNVVALTQSIERVWGSCAASPKLGFLYNNYMSAFDYETLSHPYYLRPNAAPWASVAPTIVFKGKRPWLAIGSPGSERIAPSVMQVLLRLERQTPLDAVAAPRLHCSLDGVVSLEASRMRSDVVPALQKRGFTIDERDPYSFYMGCVQLVLRDRDTYIGVADPRRDGSAAGPDEIAV